MSRSARALAAALAAWAAGCGPASGSLSGTSCGPSRERVTRVIDGDTVVLSSGERVRYLLVDTPEITNGKNECFGNEASDFNRALVLGRDVELRYDQECRDRYGRLLAYVSVAEGEVDSLLVERGFACVLHIPPNGRDRVSEFEALEARAKAEGRGLWGACSPAPCER